MHLYRFGPDGMTLATVIAPLFGVTCAAVAFDFSRRLGFDVQLRDGYVTNWKNVVIVGALASTINSIGTNIAYSNTAHTFLAFWVGDVIGLIASMLILMAAFKIYRKIA
jgi:ABC-type Co2+ transport system permease subunit